MTRPLRDAGANQPAARRHQGAGRDVAAVDAAGGAQQTGEKEAVLPLADRGVHRIAFPLGGGDPAPRNIGRARARSGGGIQ